MPLVEVSFSFVIRRYIMNISVHCPSSSIMTLQWPWAVLNVQPYSYLMYGATEVGCVDTVGGSTNTSNDIAASNPVLWV